MSNLRNETQDRPRTCKALDNIAGILETDVIAITGPLNRCAVTRFERCAAKMLDARAARACEAADWRGMQTLDEMPGNRLTILLETSGGTFGGATEIARIAGMEGAGRYAHVQFMIQNRAASAGTLLALHGERILMDEAASLGPLNVQPRRGKEQASNREVAAALAIILRRAKLARTRECARAESRAHWSERASGKLCEPQSHQRHIGIRELREDFGIDIAEYSSNKVLKACAEIHICCASQHGDGRTVVRMSSPGQVEHRTHEKESK